MRLFSGKKGKIAEDENKGRAKSPPIIVEVSGKDIERDVPPLQTLSYRTANLQGIGRRIRQEDSFGFVNAFDVTRIQEQGLLCILSDGMGGEKDGKRASSCVTSVLRELFLDFDREGDLSSQLTRAVRQADEEVYGILKGEGGATVVACLIFREKLWFSSVGDSLLYLMRDGGLFRLNRDQNVLHEEFLFSLRAGHMDPVSAREHPEKDALASFLGMGGLRDVDGFIRPLSLLPGDVLLLCSDGVGDELSNEEIRTCLREGSPETMCDRMEKAVLSKDDPFQDNYTVLIVQCEY